MNHKHLNVLSLLSGLALPFAFAPFCLSFIAVLSPAALLFVWLRSSPKAAFQRGLLFGLGFFTVGVSWVYISIHNFGGADLPLAVFITAIFIIYLALFIGTQGYFLTKIAAKNDLFKILVLFPCSWTVFEALRGWLFTGFPWLLLGYAQTNTWLRSLAPFFGVYGLSFTTTFLSSLLVLLLANAASKRTRACAAATIATLCLLSFLGTKINWTQATEKNLKVTLIQGNIEQNLKWQPDQFQKTLDRYRAYTERHWDSDLIVWPEAAVTLPLNEARPLLNDLARIAKAHGSTIMTGIPIVEPLSAYNGMITLGNGEGVYHKRHLVPFGEYTPLKFFYGFILQAFNIPMSHFTCGAKHQHPLTVAGIPVGPYICYEVAYPIEFLTFLPDAELLLTITDDSWFGHSIAAQQHLQMAQMRAIETGRYLLFGSNTGITAVIDAQGRVLKSIPTFQAGTLTTWVQPRTGQTPWMIWQNYPMAFLLFCVIICILKRRRYLLRTKREVTYSV